MENNRDGLEVFLIRSFCKIEEKWEPGKIRFRSHRIARSKWGLGDFTIRKRGANSLESGFDADLLTHTHFEMSRGNMIHSPIRYSRVAIELKYLEKQAGYEIADSEVYEFTFGTEYTTEFLTVMVPREELAQCCEVTEYGTPELDSYRKICMINQNRIFTEDSFGRIAYNILFAGMCRQADSFGLRDIIVTLSTIRLGHEWGPEWLSIWKALTYLWLDESYEYRLIAQYLTEQSGNTDSDSTHKIDRALRFLVSNMAERRRAIKALVVDAFIGTAAELQITHPILVRMSGLTNQLEILRDSSQKYLLDASLLNRLSELDLRSVVPLFEGETKRLFMELGEQFLKQFQVRFFFVSGLAEEINPLSKFSRLSPKTPIMSLVYHVLTQLESQSNRNGSGSPQNQVSLIKPANHAGDKEVLGLRGLVFHSLHRYRQRGEDYRAVQDPFRRGLIDRLTAELSASEGHLLKGHYLFCWKWTRERPWSADVTLIDLERLDLMLSEEPVTEEAHAAGWIFTGELPTRMINSRWLHIARNKIFYLEYPDALHSFWFLPEFTHSKLSFSEHLSPADFQAMTANPEGIEAPMLVNHDDFHFPLHYCRKFRLLLFADSQQSVPPFLHRRHGINLRTKLWALRLESNEKLKLVAATDFPLSSWPREIAGFHQFTTHYLEQGMSMATFNAPFSPLRWYTSRLNVYCVWLIAPQSHIVFGLKRDRFIQVSSRLKHNSLSGELPYVLPALAGNNIGGACRILWAQRKWDVEHQAYFVEMYQLRLKRY